MAENVIKLKRRAVDLGMTKQDAMKADRATLEDFISKATKSSKKATTKKTGTTKKAVAKKKGTTKKATTKKATEKKAATKKSTSKKTSTKKTSTKPKAKPRASKKNSDDDTGRAAIGEIDWTVESDYWNPRPGGPTERMFKALKKAKGNVDKAFEALKDDLYDFVGKTKRNGDKRTKAEALAVFKYRLNRTKFEYAVRTGQHESATNRVEYGSGPVAQASKKSRRASSRKPASQKPTRKASTKKTSTKKSGKRSKSRR